MSDAQRFVNPGLLTLYVSIVLMAANGIFANVIPLDATTMTQNRSVLACVVLLTLLALMRRPIKLGSIQNYIGVYIMGVLLGLHWITYFFAMQISSVAIGMLAMFSYPVMTVFVEAVYTKQRPRLSDMIAAVLVLIGIFIMVCSSILTQNFNNGVLAGAFWGCVSALLFAVRNTSQKHLLSHIGTLPLMAHQVFMVAIMLLPFASFQHTLALSTAGWVLLGLLGCFCTAAAHSLLSFSLKRLPAKSVGMISCLTPVVGGVLAWIFLDQVPELTVYIGGMIILAVAIYESLQQNKRVT